MDSFLRLTAKDLYNRYGDHLPDVAVIFPNNRAKLFFGDCLYRIAGKPVWTPSFLTINDLFSSHSQLKTADSFTLVALLYKVWLQESRKDEAFDDFYLWGELLLSDFDDVDKNRADATQLFRNIREQAAYTDTLEHLTDEQVEVIRHFFKNFNPDRKTELKERFIENWNILMQVYTNFRASLETDKLAYEGMVNRSVVEHMLTEGVSGFNYEKYAFVGFNVLNECEKTLFRLLQQAGKALFYWDYDVFYMRYKEHEAGRFMRQNLEQFPNELDKSNFDTFSTTPKHIRFIASSTENAEARYLPDWIEGLRQSGNQPQTPGQTTAQASGLATADSMGKSLPVQTEGPFRPEETAVVLCNENLLLPVLHSVPDCISELNVTMGFPLMQTPVSNLVIRICQLHADGFMKDGSERYNYRYVIPVLQHPLVRMASPNAIALEKHLRSNNVFRPSKQELQPDHFLEAVFKPVSTVLSLSASLMDILTQLAHYQGETDDSGEASISQEVTDDPLLQESIFRCYTLIARLNDSISQHLVVVSLSTFQALLLKVMSVTSIPFSGEPVRGMQIMGMLETRNLDFKNVLVLSVNEGMLPKTGGEISFIPYNLRKGFGLTTSEHKDSIFAYYFFRLLQRAENITLVYNTSSEGTNRGEMSRFMLQLLVESPHPVSHFNLHANLSLSRDRTIRIDKTPEIIRFLHHQYDLNQNKDAQTLSPTALNSLIDCSLKFYFRYVAGLKEPDEISDEIDGAVLGTLFHHAAEYIYTDILLRKAGRESHPVLVEKAREEKFLANALKNKEVSGLINASDLEPWIKGTRSLEQLADHVMRMDFFKLPADSLVKPDYSGEQLIRRRLLASFLTTLLKLDAARAPFDIAGLETFVSDIRETATENGTIAFRIGGIIDRMDKQAGRLNIIDYKTGGEPITPRSTDELFIQQEKRGNYIFQIFLYSSILQHLDSSLTLTPQLLYINKAGFDEYSSLITIGMRKEKTTVTDFAPYLEAFDQQLVNLVGRLVDPKEPFVQTALLKHCEFCPYKAICER
ncbi:MAG: PD-(D/E)XK nuclease family protein [Bacteroidota bacterium]|nr:PD-(D/E)XK nuclease family protein [Bacteroidota bacterium]